MHEQEKIKEAEYFFGRMAAEAEQRDNFKYELSAFLSAARSVLLYACKEAEVKPGGKKWYDAYLTNIIISKENLKRILNRLKLETVFSNEKSHIHICFNPDYLFASSGGTISGQPGGYSKEALRILPPFFQRFSAG